MITTTLPATSSLNRVPRTERKNLKSWKGGKKRRREKKVKGGADKLRKVWIRSIMATAKGTDEGRCELGVVRRMHKIYT